MSIKKDSPHRRNWVMSAATHCIAFSVGVILTSVLVFFSTRNYRVQDQPFISLPLQDCAECVSTRKSGVLKDLNSIHIELDILSKKVKYLLATYDLRCAAKCREAKINGVKVLPVPVAPTMSSPSFEKLKSRIDAATPHRRSVVKEKNTGGRSNGGRRSK